MTDDQREVVYHLKDKSGVVFRIRVERLADWNVHLILEDKEGRVVADSIEMPQDVERDMLALGIYSARRLSKLSPDLCQCSEPLIKCNFFGCICQICGRPER
jgi:hypothetical protein